MSDVILKSIFPVSKTVRTRTGAVNTVIGLQGAPGATGPTGATGPAGADGAAGPNTVTSSTTTNLTGFLKGDGANITGVTKIPSSSLDANNFSLTSGSTNLTLNSSYVELSSDNYAGGVAVVDSSVILSAENGIQAQNVIRPDPGNIYVFSTTVDNLTLSNKPIEYLRDTFIGTSSVDIRGLEISANVFNLAPVKILNVGTSTYTFKHESTAVSAANRYKCVTGADIQLRPNEQMEIYYDPEVSRCRVFLPTRIGMEIGGTVTGATANRVLYVGAGSVLADSQNVQISGRELQILSDDGTSTIMKLGTTGTGAFQPYIDPGLYRQLTIGNANSDLLLIGNVRVQTLYTTNGLEFLQFSQSFRMRNWVDNLPRTLACIWTSPSQLTGNVNNYNPDYGRNFRLSSSTSVDITGLSLSSQIDGMEVWFHNVGSNTITFKHQDTNSSASNRIICTTGADIALAANEAAGAIYDSTSSRWRLWKL